MSDLIQKDPRLAKVSPKGSPRNLLDDPTPLEATVEQTPITVVLDLENGMESPIQLSVTSDQEWLVPQNKQLSMVGGQNGQLRLTINDRGQSEFANLCLRWEGMEDTYIEYVLVWRKLKKREEQQEVYGWMKPCVHCEKMIIAGDIQCSHCHRRQE